MTKSYESPTAAQHRQQALQKIGCAVVTVSDTRTLDTDISGQTIVELLETAGHTVIEHVLIPDEPMEISTWVLRLANTENVQAILLTGGTCIADRDQTPETLGKLFTKELPGYGELLRMLSYQEIGPAAMLSRATGGVVDETVVLTMPGSTSAVRLAMDKLILPELGHLVAHSGR